jgi:hypothetical protein
MGHSLFFSRPSPQICIRETLQRLNQHCLVPLTVHLLTGPRQSDSLRTTTAQDAQLDNTSPPCHDSPLTPTYPSVFTIHRSRVLPRLFPIVLVYPTVPSVGSGVWEAVSQFQEVFLSAGGDTTEMLLRAHVEKAAMVLLMTDTRSGGGADNAVGAHGQLDLVQSIKTGRLGSSCSFKL